VARNIEIKARVEDPVALRRQAAAVSTSGPTLLTQRDTFYFVPKGRLKLREFADGGAELIFYERPDDAGPKVSSYVRVPISDPQSMSYLLDRMLGTRTVVSKRRELFMVGRTRIHLDDVEGLGSFMELEVVLGDDEADSEGEAIAAGLIEQLGIQPQNLIDKAYVDLLETAAA